MTKAKAPLKLVAFDAARHLNDDEAVAECMTAVLETNDPDLLLLALSDVARAKGAWRRWRKTLAWAARAFTRHLRQAQNPALKPS